MFIRKKAKRDPKTDKEYFTYQLVRSIRTELGPRQEILLSIGNALDLTERERKLLANRIEEVAVGVQTFLPPPDHIERLAHLFARQLIKKRALETEKPAEPHPKTEPQAIQEPTEDFETVDLNTLKHQNCRTVGIEYIALETFRQLGLDKKLADLGLNQSEIEVACGVIIGRLVRPGSDLATYYWLQNLTALDELLGADFSRISLKRVYKIADKLLSKKKALESYLEYKEEDLFSFNSTIALYDITNTYFEGSACDIMKAKRGRSKDKRKDCPLIALGLVLNEEGFPKRSHIFGTRSQGLVPP